jgi:hypothetical protein
MKITAQDLKSGMLFMVEDRLYLVVDMINGGKLVEIDCRRLTELGEILSDFCVPPSHGFDLPEVS